MEDGKEVARSEVRPVALGKIEDGRPCFTAPAQPLPLRLTFFEWAVLHLDWQLGAVRSVSIADPPCPCPSLC